MKQTAAKQGVITFANKTNPKDFQNKESQPRPRAFPLKNVY